MSAKKIIGSRTGHIYVDAYGSNALHIPSPQLNIYRIFIIFKLFVWIFFRI